MYRRALATKSIVIILAIIIASISILMFIKWSLTPPSTSSRLSPILSGAGATFPYPQIAHWATLLKSAKNISISYQSVGSGAGQSMFLKERVVDFAGSDPPLTKSQWEEYRGRVMQIPWMLGAVVVVYNVPEIPSNYNLRLTGEIIAKIYKGVIERWDDPAIKEVNQEIADILPSQPIIAVHRSDASGTTDVFTTFLNKAAPNIWTRELVGKQVDWPVDATGRGVGGKGNEGVAATVKQTPYSIGYIELSYAIELKLPIAAIKNAVGEFVLPTDKAIMKAATDIKWPSSVLDDFSYTLAEIVYSPATGSYPISSPTYLFLWKSYEDKSKALALAEFLEWILKEGYSNMVPGYVAPPSEVETFIKEAISILRS